MSKLTEKTPTLYSFRRCPYAIRARLTLALRAIKVNIVEVKLSEKPAKLLALSEKGTVPVLVLPCGQVIDESLDIMIWANQAQAKTFDKNHELIVLNDTVFKQKLDRYKYFEKFPQQTQEAHKEACYFFLDRLESKLTSSFFIEGESPSLVDVAIMPFIRQFSKVDESWFNQSPYIKIQKWLSFWLNNETFKEIMLKNHRKTVID